LQSKFPLVQSKLSLSISRNFHSGKKKFDKSENSSVFKVN
jgi:hypothetical protein